MSGLLYKLADMVASQMLPRTPLSLAKVARQRAPEVVDTIIAGLPKYSQGETSAALKHLLALNPTPRRAELINNPDLRRLLANPAVQNAYAFGSITTRKPSPNDMDLLLNMSPEHVKFPRIPGTGWVRSPQARRALFSMNDLEGPDKYHFVDSPITTVARRHRSPTELDEYKRIVLKDIFNMLKVGMNPTERNYGPDYDFVRLAGGAGGLLGLARQYLDEREQTE